MKNMLNVMNISAVSNNAKVRFYFAGQFFCAFFYFFGAKKLKGLQRCEV